MTIMMKIKYTKFGNTYDAEVSAVYRKGKSKSSLDPDNIRILVKNPSWEIAHRKEMAEKYGPSKVWDLKEDGDDLYVLYMPSEKNYKDKLGFWPRDKNGNIEGSRLMPGGGEMPLSECPEVIGDLQNLIDVDIDSPIQGDLLNETVFRKYPQTLRQRGRNYYLVEDKDIIEKGLRSIAENQQSIKIVEE